MLRYGAFAPEVIERLRFMATTLAPLLGKTLERRGPIDLRTLMAQALQMGDEGHNRNRAGTSLLFRELAPAMVRAGTPLGDVDGVFNAVAADTGAAGQFFFEGRGAGEAATATAVIADIVDIARCNIGPEFGIPARTLIPLSPAPSGSASSAFYLRFQVLDVPGVLAEIAGRLAEWRVSIESMIQRGRAPVEAVSIVMITHETTHAAVDCALKTNAASDKVISPPCMIPMEAK